MRQKYLIVCDPKKRTLIIKEYAVIEKNLTNTDTSMLRPEDYSLLHEEVYDGPIIGGFISDGTKALVAKLRTQTFFPVERHAAKIAESVIKLLHSSNNHSLELFIDDLDGKQKKAKEELDSPVEMPESRIIAQV
jgi:hypothetical protein